MKDIWMCLKMENIQNMLLELELEPGNDDTVNHGIVGYFIFNQVPM